MSSNKASDEEIQAFLKDFKSFWRFTNYFVLPSNGKNDQTLIQLGITPYQRKEEIMSLGIEHYYKGPEEDRDGFPGEVWFFKKIVKKREIYIKLKTFEEDGKGYGKCMSFHL